MSRNIPLKPLCFQKLYRYILYSLWIVAFFIPINCLQEYSCCQFKDFTGISPQNHCFFHCYITASCRVMWPLQCCNMHNAQKQSHPSGSTILYFLFWMYSNGIFTANTQNTQVHAHTKTLWNIFQINNFSKQFSHKVTLRGVEI